MTDQEKIARFYLPCIKSQILHALYLVRSGQSQEGTDYLTHVLECAEQQTDLAMNVANGLAVPCQTVN